MITLNKSLPIALAFFAMNCLPAFSQNISLKTTPSSVIFGDAGTMGQAKLRNQIAGIAIAADKVISARPVGIVVDAAIPIHYINCNCYHNIDNLANGSTKIAPENIDIRVTDWPGSWTDNSGTPGYETALVHLQYPQGSDGPQSGYRLIEVTNRLSDLLPEYFSAATASTRIAVLSNIYGFIDLHPGLFKIFADAINDQNPDYVFMLGNLVPGSTRAAYEDLEQNFFSLLNAPYIFVPGHIESRPTASKRIFDRNVAPPPPVIITPNANILIINSSTQLPRVKAQLRYGFKEIKQAGTQNNHTTLITHHKIWRAFWPANTRLRKPLFNAYNVMKMISGEYATVGKVDSIIDGDRNEGVIYQLGWENMPSLSIGNGIKGSQAQLYYSMVELAVNDEKDDGAKIIRIKPFYFDMYANHPWYTGTY